MNQKPLKIVITGPESTGKSTITEHLANHFHAPYIPEFARSYIENLNRIYTYTDVELIAKQQIADFKHFSQQSCQLLFIDTYLIITKVWFDVVFGKHPSWIIDEIKNSKIDLFLLCNTDIPWIADSVRENGGKMREILFEKYKTELEHFGFNYHIISGLDENRKNNAIQIVNELTNK